MDVLKHKFCCQKHDGKKLKLIQIDEINKNINSQQLFYCSSCVFDDQRYNNSNYIQIEKIIDNAPSKMIQKWPPLNDNRIVDKLIELLGQDDSQYNQRVQEVQVFFDKLKTEVITKIDLIFKNFMKDIQKRCPQNIIIKYEEISKVSELKELLLKRKERNFLEFQEEYRLFYQQMESKRETNTKLMQSLLEDYQSSISQFDQNQKKQIKQQIAQDLLNTTKEQNMYLLDRKYKRAQTEATTLKHKIAPKDLQQSIKNLQIFVQITLTGKTIEIDANKLDTVESIINEISSKEGIPSVQYQLFYGGQLLQQQNSLQFYKIENQSKIQLAFIKTNKKYFSSTAEIFNRSNHN